MVGHHMGSEEDHSVAAVEFYNAELFTEQGQFILQWLERRDGGTWLRRRARVSQPTGMKLKRMEHMEVIKWIHAHLPPEKKHGRSGTLRAKDRSNKDATGR